MRMTLADVLNAAGAAELHPRGRLADVIVTGAATDNRQVKPGDIFVCLRGEHTDGHRYAADAVRAGAVAVLADHDPFEGETDARVLLTPVLLANDTVRALGRLGHAWRAAFRGKVIGVTGTAGKTTVKEILASVLAVRGPTAKNHLNLNTQVGLPVSILSTSGDEDFWVMEAGISQAGDMDELGPILEPDLALILNVGCGHTLGLGEKGTAHHKARLLAWLAPGGQALASADYPDLVKEARAVFPSCAFFSTSGKPLAYRAAYRGLSAPESGPERGMYRLWLEDDSFDVTCALSGHYGAENVIAAAAAAHMLGLTPQEIAQGLESAELPGQRFARFAVPGWTAIDDSYNANPLSCGRVLDAVSELARGKSLVCVMGEMLELGDRAAEEHTALGRALASSGAEAVFWMGGFGREVREGLDSTRFRGVWRELAGPEDFWPALQDWLAQKSRPEGLILFKGSRGNKMERLVRIFREQMENGHAV